MGTPTIGKVDVFHQPLDMSRGYQRFCPYNAPLPSSPSPYNEPAHPRDSKYSSTVTYNGITTAGVYYQGADKGPTVSHKETVTLHVALQALLQIGWWLGSTQDSE